MTDVVYYRCQGCGRRVPADYTEHFYYKDCLECSGMTTNCTYCNGTGRLKIACGPLIPITKVTIAVEALAK